MPRRATNDPGTVTAVQPPQASPAASVTTPATGAAADSSAEATARLAAIVASSADAIISKTLDGVITSWNQAAERMFGFTAEEAIGRHISLIIPEPLAHEEDMIIGRIRRGEAVEPFETRRRTRDGRLLDVSLSVSPVVADGVIIGASKIARDITDRKRTEALLARQTAHLGLLLDASRLFAASHFDLPGLMRHLMDMLVPSLADSGYVRQLSDDRGWIETIEVRHRDPVFEQQERAVTALPQPVHEGMTGAVLRSGRAVFLPQVDDTAFREATAPQYRASVGRSRMSSFMMVPMRARGTVRGALAVGRQQGRAPFTGDDLEVVQELADLAALAMATFDAFRLLGRERDALALSERRFRALADHAPDVILRFDREGRHVYVNPRTTAVTGLPADHFLDRTHRELGFPEPVCRLWEAKLEAAFANREATLSLELTGPDGPRQFEARLVPERGSDGTIATVLAMARDVTELTLRARRGEEAFRSVSSMAERLRATADVDTLLDALILDAMALVGAEAGCAGIRTDEGMHTERYFRGAEAVPLTHTWGRGEGLPGWLIEHRVPYLTNDAAGDPQIAQALCAQFGVRSALSVPVLDGTGDPIGFFEVHNKRDGQPFTGADLRLLVAISHTAAVAMLSARALQRARDAERIERAKAGQLEELVRELETFAYSVAHDLRAPVRAMDGYSQILLEDHGAKLGPHGRAVAVRITESSRRMDDMIRDLLAYSRLSRDEVALQEVDLGLVVHTALEQVKSDVAARAAVVEVAPALPHVTGHPTVLVQVVANLVANAVKFVAPGVQPRVRIAHEARGTRVRLWVEDNGIGIAPEYHDRLFRVFERLYGPDAFPGTGIGLAIVRRGMERMDGRAGVESAPGSGSRFWIELPGIPST